MDDTSADSQAPQDQSWIEDKKSPAYTMTFLPSLKRLFSIVALAVIAGALPTVLLLTQQQTNTQQEAAYGDNLYTCKISVTKEGALSSPLTPAADELIPGQTYNYSLEIKKGPEPTALFTTVHNFTVHIDTVSAADTQGPPFTLTLAQITQIAGCKIDQEEPTKISCAIRSLTAPVSTIPIQYTLSVKPTITETAARRGIRTYATLAYIIGQQTQEREALKTNRGRPVTGNADCLTHFDFQYGPTLSNDYQPKVPQIGGTVTLTGKGFAQQNSVKIEEYGRSSGNTTPLPVGYIHNVSSTPNGTTIQVPLPKTPLTGCSDPQDARRIVTSACNRTGLTLQNGKTYNVSVINPLGMSNPIVISL